MTFFLKLKDESKYSSKKNKQLEFNVATDNSAKTVRLQPIPDTWGGLPCGSVDYHSGAAPGDWKLTVKQDNIDSLPTALIKKVTVDGEKLARLNPEAIEDIGIVCAFVSNNDEEGT